MTVATLTRNGFGFKLRIEGHSCYSNEAEDVVCAAISGIFYAFGGYLIALREGEVRINSLESAFVDIDCSVECEELLRAVYFGLLLIEKSYPENLRVDSVLWKQIRAYFN